MGEWETVCLGDHVDLLTGFPFKSAQFTNRSGDVRLIRGDNVVQGAIRWQAAARWNADDVEEYNKFQLQVGDVVVAMDRPWIEAGLKWACLRVDDVPALLVQRVSRLRARGRLVQGFLRAVIGHPGFTAYVKSITTGANVPHISGPDIRKYQFKIPSVRWQKRIASVLAAYDDLIENNMKRIGVLEEMARVLYREWFVRRATTNAATNEWKQASFGQIVSLVKRTVAPSSVPDTEYDLFSFEACDQGRLPIATFGRSIQSNKFDVPDGVVLLPKLNPHIPRVWLPFLEGDRPKICSTEFLVLRPSHGIPRSYLYSMVEDGSFSACLAQRADGTSNSHKRLKPDDVLAQPVVVPPQALLDRYSAFADGVFEQCHVLRKKNRALRAARDLLLPKLLSGELSVDRIPDPAEVAP